MASFAMAIASPSVLPVRDTARKSRHRDGVAVFLFVEVQDDRVLPFRHVHTPSRVTAGRAAGPQFAWLIQETDSSPGFDDDARVVRDGHHAWSAPRCFRCG